MPEIPKLITGWRAGFIRRMVLVNIIAEAFKFYRNPFRAISEMKRLRNLRQKVHGGNLISKYVRSGNHYFWNSDYCGYPSENLKSAIHSEFIRNSRAQTEGITKRPLLQTIIWGITNRCPLSCRHCYEWDNIAQSEHVNLNGLKAILAVFTENGIRHIQFSGGEPMARFKDLTMLISDASRTMDCWLLTSGFGLTLEKALTLKDAGLTGANISLDHWDAATHNSFRNNDQSYEMATEAVRNCLDAGIIASLSLCATREFVTEENLIRYATLAKSLGALFIRILEPRAVGKFSGQMVHLEKEQVEMLSEFAIRMNSSPRYKDFPIVTFFGYHQRKMGCFGGGNRYIYADPNGDVHACPFCRGRMGNLLEEPFDEIIGHVKSVGCHLFESQI